MRTASTVLAGVLCLAACQDRPDTLSLLVVSIESSRASMDSLTAGNHGSVLKDAIRSLLQVVALQPDAQTPPPLLILGVSPDAGATVSGLHSDTGSSKSARTKRPSQPDTASSSKDTILSPSAIPRRDSAFPAQAYLLLGGPPDSLGTPDSAIATRRTLGLQFLFRLPAATIRNLGDCFGRGEASVAKCSADIPGHPVRLFGFPLASQELAGQVPRLVWKALPGAQAKIDSALALARKDRKKLVVLTNLVFRTDDTSLELTLGEAAGPLRTLLDSPSVLGVLATADCSWALVRSSRCRLLDGNHETEKLFAVPPLILDSLRGALSPIAQGFGLMVASGSSRLGRSLYWYDRSLGTFLPGREYSGGSIQASPAWWRPTQLWRLPDSSADLARASIWAIAMLAAFLTVVEIWRIPPPSPNQRQAGTDAADANPEAPQPASAGEGVLQGKFAKTVLSGLGGLAAVAFVGEALWKDATTDAKAYYLVLFVILFLVLLLIFAVIRGFVEALRSGLASQFRPRSTTGMKTRGYSSGRFLRWLRSWRSPVLVWFDTALNAIQGKNELESVVWDKTIVDLQRSLLATTDRIRLEIDSAVRASLRRSMPPGPPDRGIRVNISLVTEDQRAARYVSWSHGSLGTDFTPRSLAYLASVSGQPFWWREGYPDETPLLDDVTGLIPGEKGAAKLKDYFETRPGQDYKAFMLVPFPWARRGVGASRSGAIHMSFNTAEDFDRVFKNLDSREKAAEEESERAKKALDAAKENSGKATEASKAASAALQAAHQQLKTANETLQTADLSEKAHAQAKVDQANEVLDEPSREADTKAEEEREAKAAERVAADAVQAATAAGRRPDYKKALALFDESSSGEGMYIEDCRVRAVLRHAVEVLAAVLGQFNLRLFDTRLRPFVQW